MLDGRAPEVSSWQDLGALQFLLSVQDDEALRLYTDSVLGPIENGEGEYGGELLRSLEAFVEHNGQWERAARQLFCHRHTLRYRIRRVEQLTGRDLSSARDRIEFWLALKARELVSVKRRADRRRARRRRHDRAGGDQGPCRVGRGGRAAAAGRRREASGGRRPRARPGPCAGASGRRPHRAGSGAERTATCSSTAPATA